MKDKTIAHQRHSQPLTRAQRRAAERARPRARKTQPRRLSTSAIVGGVVTVLAVLAILVYAFARNTASGGQKGLADPSALNPRTALLALGSQAPNFALQDASGRTYHLAAQRGHPVLLEFFAVWCPV